MLVGNSAGDDSGGGSVGVVVYGFGSGVISSSLSYSSIIVGVDADLDVV